MKIKSIFLSSDTDSSLPIRDFCNENQIILVRKSFISFQRIPFQDPGNWNVVFFSSPRSVDFFISENFTLEADQQIACIGAETKSHIESKGFHVFFFGENSGKPTEIANQFKDWLGNRTAVFPQSVKSNKSIEALVPDEQKIPLIVYNTIETPIRLTDSFSIFIFTSPSNYRSFTSLNPISNEAIVVAWGDTTAKAIEDNGVKVDFILQTSTYSELLQILKKLI